MYSGLLGTTVGLHHHHLQIIRPVQDVGGRVLLRVSVQHHSPSGHVALDSTFFDRGHASAYYLPWSERSVETLNVTTVTKTESLAVLDVQCYAQWKHDTKAGPQVVRRNVDDLLSVAADNAFQDRHTVGHSNHRAVLLFNTEPELKFFEFTNFDG